MNRHQTPDSYWDRQARKRTLRKLTLAAFVAVVALGCAAVLVAATP